MERADVNVELTVRTRLGLLGKATVAAAEFLSRRGLTLPVAVLVWAVNYSTFVSVNDGPWQRRSLGLDAKDFE